MLGKSVSDILSLGNELRRQAKAKGVERETSCLDATNKIMQKDNFCFETHAQQSGHQLLGNEQEAHQN